MNQCHNRNEKEKKGVRGSVDIGPTALEYPLDGEGGEKMNARL